MFWYSDSSAWAEFHGWFFYDNDKAYVDIDNIRFSVAELFDNSSHLFYVFVLYREKCMGGISLTLNLCRSQRWCRWWQLQRPWSFCFNCFGRWALLKWSEFCFTQCAYQIAMPRCILNCFHDSFSWKISDHGAKGKPPKKLCSAW